MIRRTFIQAAAATSTRPRAFALAQDSDEGLGSRELVVHTVHNALRNSSPLLIYAGLQTTLGVNRLLVDAAGGEPAVEVWNDWNDYDLRQAFGAFTVGTPDVSLGSNRIFDTPDIAHGVHQPIVDEIEQGYVPVGGYRASFMAAGSVGFARLRLWNVIIDGFAESEDELSDVMLGLVRHLGQSIGAID